MKLFLAIAEAGSLTRAAARLNTTQPTVTRRLEELETRLGVTLAIRDSSGIALTEAGRAVAAHAGTMARAAAAISQEVGMRDKAVAGQVTMSCPDALATFFLAPALPGFQRAFPEISLALRTRSDHPHPPDLSIQFHEAKRMEDVAIPLGWAHYVGFASQSYVELFGTPTAITDAFQHKVVTHTDYREQMDRWRSKMKPLQEMVELTLLSDCGSFVIAATAEGAGVSTMPTFVARIDPRLIVLDTGEHARLQFWVVFDRARGELPRVRETINWLRSVFDPGRNPWFREEFIHPDEFDSLLQT